MFHTVGTNGQYIAVEHQATGEVNMWNITEIQRQATLQVFQGIKCYDFMSKVWQACSVIFIGCWVQQLLLF